MIRSIALSLVFGTLLTGSLAAQAAFVNGKIDFEVTRDDEKTIMTIAFKPGQQVWTTGPFAGERLNRQVEYYASMRRYTVADDNFSYSWQEIAYPPTPEEARKRYAELPVPEGTRMIAGMACTRFLLLDKKALPDSLVITGWTTKRIKGPTLGFHPVADMLIPGLPLEYQTGKLKKGVLMLNLTVKAQGINPAAPDYLLQLPDTTGAAARTQNSPFGLPDSSVWTIARKTRGSLVLQNAAYSATLELHRNNLRSPEIRRVADFLIRETGKKPELTPQALDVQGKPALRWNFPREKTSGKKGPIAEKTGYVLFRGPEVWNHAMLHAPEKSYEQAEQAVLELLQTLTIRY